MPMSATVTTDEHTLEAQWHRAYLPAEQRHAYMAGAQDALVALQAGATRQELQAEIVLWARTYVGCRSS